MTQPFKVCPACGQRLALYMQQCGRCKALQPHVSSPIGISGKPFPVNKPAKRSPVLVGVVGFVGGLMLVGMAISVISPKTPPRKRHVLLHTLDGPMVPAVFVHERNEDGTGKICPLEDGTRGDAGSDINLNGSKCAGVHLTSGYKAGTDVIVPSECIEDVSE